MLSSKLLVSLTGKGISGKVLSGSAVSALSVSSAGAKERGLRDSKYSGWQADGRGKAEERAGVVNLKEKLCLMERCRHGKPARFYRAVQNR